MGAGHEHGHSAQDADLSSSAPKNRRRLLLVLALTLGALLAQVVGAAVSGSLALLADTAHAAVDSAGLSIALFAAHLAARPFTARRSWGYRRVEVIGAALQATVLLLVAVYVVIAAIRRLAEPPPVSSAVVLFFGALGLAANVAGILILTRGGRSSNVNMRAALLEVINDALGSLAVLISAAIIALTGWERADAAASLVIAVLIFPRAFRLLRETLTVLLEAAPPGLDLDEVRAHLLQHPRVTAVHDLHASQITSGLPTLTAHVVVDDACIADGYAQQTLNEIQECLDAHFPVSVKHATVQLEIASRADHVFVSHNAT